MKKVKDVIAWANEADNRYIDICEGGTNNCIKKSLNRVEASKIAGSFEGVLEKLAKDGYTDIYINYVTKTASGWNNRKGPVFGKLELSNNNTPAATSPNNATMSSSVTHTPAGTAAGLSIPGLNIPGLGFPEIMNLNTQAQRGLDYKADLEKLQIKYEALKEQYEDLRENKRDEAAAEARQAQYLSLAETFGPLLANIIPKGSNAVNPALNGPQDAALYSGTKNALLSVIKQPGVDDRLCELIYHSIGQIQKGNQQFLNQLTELINTSTNA